MVFMPSVSVKPMSSKSVLSSERKKAGSASVCESVFTGKTIGSSTIGSSKKSGGTDKSKSSVKSESAPSCNSVSPDFSVCVSAVTGSSKPSGASRIKSVVVSSGNDELRVSSSNKRLSSSVSCKSSLKRDSELDSGIS